MFKIIEPTAIEISKMLPGDTIVPQANAIMDRAFSLPASPDKVWPWFVQLGKKRAGWYFPAWVERFILPSRRGLRTLDPQFQQHAVGDIIDDWGGKHGYLEVVQIDMPNTLLYQSVRGAMHMSWAITLKPEAQDLTRVHIRLRLGPIKHRFLLGSIGEFFDALTIAGLAAGLRERLSKQSRQS